MTIFFEYLQENAAKKNKSIEEWLSDAAEQAQYCKWANCVGKFSHPSIGSDLSILAKSNNKMEDGYLYTANVQCKPDVVTSSAAYISSSKLIMLELEDGKTVFDHLQKSSKMIRQEFAGLKVDYEEIRSKMLRAQVGVLPLATDERLKQVYFPMSDGTYSLLSVLPSSSLMMEMKERIYNMESKAKKSRKKEDMEYGETYAQILGLTDVLHGGGKIQNISLLNLRQGGRTFLLQSTPPTLLQRDIVQPHHDFFKETLKIWEFKDAFRRLHDGVVMARKHNLEIRNKRKQILCEDVIEAVLIRVYRLRSLPEGWSDVKGYQLSSAQKIWLDDACVEERNQNEDWIQDIVNEFARWIREAYEKLMKPANKPVFGDAEMLEFKKQILSVLKEDKEAIE